MRIKPLPQKIIYDKNPLAEVVCQVRFDPLPIGDAVMTSFNAKLASMGYLVSTFEQVATFQFAASLNGESAHMDAPQPVPVRVYHQSSPDGVWRVSHSVDFVALTCTRYSTWGEFEDKFRQILMIYTGSVGVGNSTRIGLRYRDIVDRQNLEIEGMAWAELIQPFVLGPLAAYDMVDGAIPEEDIVSYSFQSNIRLDDCGLLFQGGLIRSIDGSKVAFVIDSDFYVDGDAAVGCMADESRLECVLTALHKNASALFAHSIKGSLKNALCPRSPE